MGWGWKYWKKVIERYHVLAEYRGKIFMAVRRFPKDYLFSGDICRNKLKSIQFPERLKYAHNTFKNCVHAKKDFFW